jgi:hypothetical protein
MSTGSFLWVKRPARVIDHPPPSSAEVKERVDVYVFLLWAFIACSRVNFTLLYLYSCKYNIKFQVMYIVFKLSHNKVTSALTSIDQELRSPFERIIPLVYSKGR